MENKIYKIKSIKGSALILAVVLTSLLAVVGVMFIMVSRVDTVSTSAVTEDKELNLAIDSVVARISQELVADVNFKDPNAEYFDYPGVRDLWLASIEPYNSGTALNPFYEWKQISDVTGYIRNRWGWTGHQDVNVDPPGSRKVIEEYPQISLNGGLLDEQLADSDGDGIADSKWIEFDNGRSKGRLIYAAIRIIDNGGMLNVNTAYKFDPNQSRQRIDGSTQSQVNLSSLVKKYTDDFNSISLARWGLLNPTDTDISNYEKQVVWPIDLLGAFLPFDISDEIALRNRYCLLSPAQTRIERQLYWSIGQCGYFLDRQYDGYRDLSADPKTWRRLDDWELRILDHNNSAYDRRHLLTTYNLDRIMDAGGSRMINANKIDANNLKRLANVLKNSILQVDPNTAGADVIAAQTAVNMKDFLDGDAQMTSFSPDPNDSNVPTVYGFEKPGIFISELVHKLVKEKPQGGPIGTPAPTYMSYAIELRKRHYDATNSNTDNWQLEITKGATTKIIDINDFGRSNRRYEVLLSEDGNAPVSQLVKFTDSPDNDETEVSQDVVLTWPTSGVQCDVYFGTNHTDVSEANSVNPRGVRVINQQAVASYDPVILNPGKTYYWRVDDISSGNVIGSTGVMNFTVGNPLPRIDPNTFVFDSNSIITLKRNGVAIDSVTVGNNNWLVDGTRLNNKLLDPNFVSGKVESIVSLQRDMTANRWIKKLWDTVSEANPGTSTLGSKNIYENPTAAAMPTHLEDGRFNNVGDIGKVFAGNAYGIDPNTSESGIRLDLGQPRFQQILRYLTIMDPADHNSATIKIKGRININTAPWYVIAQLPWVSQRNGYNSYALAKAITAYRDKTLEDPNGPDYRNVSLIGFGDGRNQGTGIIGVREEPGFASIGELENVINKKAGLTDYDIRYYANQSFGFVEGYPDLTFDSRLGHDGVAGDMEKRDLIFARISDLVTVRSDVFTAYILVRLGADGPQKRVIAILDRSDVLPGDKNGKVKIISLHPVPDPR